MTTWADCSVGADPTKTGSDLLWVEVTSVKDCATSADLRQLAAGPTGDIALGLSCDWFASISNDAVAPFQRLNGSGFMLFGAYYAPVNTNAADNSFGWNGLDIYPDIGYPRYRISAGFGYRIPAVSDAHQRIPSRRTKAFGGPSPSARNDARRAPRTALLARSTVGGLW